MSSTYRLGVALVAIALVTMQAPQDAQSSHGTLTESQSILPSEPSQDVCTDRVSPETWLTAPSDIKAHLQPLSAGEWAAFSPEERRYLNAADSFTLNFVQALFPEGPYPACLYQSLRAYFLPGPEGAIERARGRRERALEIVRLVEASLKD